MKRKIKQISILLTVLVILLGGLWYADTFHNRSQGQKALTSWVETQWGSLFKQADGVVKENGDTDTSEVSENELEKGLEKTIEGIQYQSFVKSNTRVEIDREKPSQVVKKYPDYYYKVNVETSINKVKQLNIKDLYQSLAKMEDKVSVIKDNKNRITAAYVRLNQDSITRNYGNQQSFPSNENPLGWPKKNKKVTIPHPEKGDYNGWFWNRSHLIADQLGGQSVADNAITGTRPQNVGARDNQGGMRVPESRAYEYVKNEKKSLLYYVEPIYYEEKDVIPTEVVVTLYNEELFEQYVTLNIANGFVIDYQKGTFVEQK